MRGLNGWEDYPCNLRTEYPQYDLEYCRRRLNDDAKRLFSDTGCNIIVQTILGSTSSNCESACKRTSIKDLVKDEESLEQTLDKHLSKPGSHFIILQQPYSWAPFDVPKEVVFKLFTALEVPPTFLGLVHVFGHPEDGYQREFTGGYDIRFGILNDDFQLLYTIRYMARTGRESWPWSERRVGIYYKIANDSETWLILQHMSFLRSLTGMRAGEELDCGRLTGSGTIARHVALIESTSRRWNDYLKLIEAQVRRDVRRELPI
ncbi:hypothetical protein BCR34DRAFT_339306 [Clohesyomyces aquaticus]|uniref:CorA-like transporter domain-containing protein n=1 Tax=Clohesyomyces aquaticus TaxID=1231657 RepID=A0A1Y1ZKR6_9PLEO|nr:hypothetical protein BCR34DRAFT_339306 [Clohesyomyces aquaticus]